MLITATLFNCQQNRDRLRSRSVEARSMNQLTRWREFSEDPRDDYDGKSGKILMIILAKNPRPRKGAYIKLAGNSQPDYEKLGYIVEDGKLKRVPGTRFFISPEMQEIAKWCDDNKLYYSWNIKPNGGPLLDDRFLEIQGDITAETLATFPVARLAAKIL